MEGKGRKSYPQRTEGKSGILGRNSCIVFCFLLCAFSTIAYSQDSVWQVREISFSGNHITREHILQREISLNVGDSLSWTEISQAAGEGRQNLENTGLFNFVEMEIRVLDSSNNHLSLHYTLTERWYLWPLPVFEIADRNINSWWESGAFRRANYGFLVTHHNMRGRKEKLTAAFLTGHENLLSLVYDFPYLDRNRLWGAWGGFSYATTRELLLGEENNRPVWFDSQDLVLQQRLRFGVGAHYRPGFYHRFQLSTVYEKIRLHDSVVISNPRYPYREAQLESALLSLKFYYQWDRRDQRYYPLDGHYLDVNLDWHFTSAAGLRTLEWQQSFLMNARRYIPLSHRWYASGGWTGFLSLPGSSPFLFHQGLGFDRKFVRGYEDFLFTGEAYALAKTELKWALMPQREMRLPFIPYTQFNRLHLALFLSAFADGGWIYQRLPEGGTDREWLGGYGLGMNLVTYYDKVLRLEYSRNKMGKGGFFVHVLAPI